MLIMTICVWTKQFVVSYLMVSNHHCLFTPVIQLSSFPFWYMYIAERSKHSEMTCMHLASFQTKLLSVFYLSIFCWTSLQDVYYTRHCFFSILIGMSFFFFNVILVMFRIVLFLINLDLLKFVVN